jgi:hypothetical protein
VRSIICSSPDPAVRAMTTMSLPERIAKWPASPVSRVRVSSTGVASARRAFSSSAPVASVNSLLPMR